MAMKAVKGEELFLTTENKTGMLETICRLISETGANIRAFCADVVQGKAHFRIITSDNVKARKALAHLGLIEMREVVIVELSDHVGALATVSGFLARAAIDILYIYGTANQPQKASIIVFASNNNDKALQALVS